MFDDGRQLFVEFAESVAMGEMPPLFVIGEKDQAELVNYRVEGRFLVVDRLFERAELRLRLGPVIEEKPVKLTVELPGSLLRDLSDYARVHARLNNLSEPLLPERLIPPMIERFIAGDREFGKQRRRP